MDRKLTCIDNQLNFLTPFLSIPEWRNSSQAIEALQYIERGCDKGYIFSGILK